MTSIHWIIFNAFVIGMLILDLKVFHRKAHEIHVKEALGWSAFWIILALLFNAGIYVKSGSVKAMEFLTGYLIEKSLSVDNLFVFLAVFSYFNVKSKFQHNILFWGILGALIMRAIFIFAGVSLLNMFHWIIYVFGAFLIYTGYKIWAQDEDKKIDPEANPVVRFFRKIIPVTTDQNVGTFFVKQNGKIHATYLFIVLLVIETTDVIFAVDSIPAILAISRDPFIVYSSNVFAILGLRALYFALADALRLFHFLNVALAFILVFVGSKMLITFFNYHVPIVLTLSVVGGALTLAITTSLMFPKKQPIE